MTTAKNEPPGYGEMVAMESGRKKNQLYRAESMAVNDEKIRSIMAATTEQLEMLSHVGRKLSLQDTEDIKRQSLIYMRACETSGVTPTWAGLCRAFGYTRQAVDYFVKRNSSHDTSVWLSMVHDAISEALADAALHGAVQPIVSIFILKSRSGWHEDNESPFDSPHETESIERTAEEIATKYDMLPD